MKDKEKLTYYGLSDMGRQRTNNEDAFVAEQLDENAILAVAIDGVGGYEGGEVAAEIAQTEIPKYLHEFKNGERIELLKQAVISANNAIYERRQLDTARSNMSCVLTSAIVDKGRKVVDMVHVGDTRIYQYRQRELRKLSHDHSLIGYREEVGDLTEEQAMHHPQRNVISRDVGSAKHEVEDRDFLEAEEFPLLPNSIFLLCSDGLTDLITSKQIVSILEQTITLEEKTQKLIDAANEAGGKDNITVVLVEYQAEEEENIVMSDNVDVKSPMIKESQTEKEMDGTPFNDSEKPKSGKKRWFLIIAGSVWLISIPLIILVLAYSYQYGDSPAVEYIKTFSSCLFFMIPLVLICIWLYGRIKIFQSIKMDLLRENYARLSKKKRFGIVLFSFFHGFGWFIGYLILSVVIIALCAGVTLSFDQDPELTYENYGEELDKVSYFVYMEWKNTALFVFGIITIIITIIAIVLSFYFAGKRFFILLSDKISCSRSQISEIDTDIDELRGWHEDSYKNQRKDSV